MEKVEHISLVHFLVNSSYPVSLNIDNHSMVVIASMMALSIALERSELIQ